MFERSGGDSKRFLHHIDVGNPCGIGTGCRTSDEITLRFMGHVGRACRQTPHVAAGHRIDDHADRDGQGVPNKKRSMNNQVAPLK